MADKCLIFVYGMLKPDQTPPRSISHHWPDALRGELYDVGPYPALVKAGDETCDWVEGVVIEIDQDELPLIDDFEDTDSGEYVRVTRTTRNGFCCFVYQYARPLPTKAVPIKSWPVS